MSRAGVDGELYGFRSGGYAVSLTISQSWGDLEPTA